MSEEEFQRQCQAWEACANQYYTTNNRYLFTEDQIEGESRGYADDATWILTSSFVIFTSNQDLACSRRVVVHPALKLIL